MKWEHKCDLDWLRKRQRFLTASDIKKLLPVTATGRPKIVSDLDRIKIMSNKMVTLTEEDCMSYGAAARGHILEPYAIDALNQMLFAITGKDEEFFWWDDEIVSLPGRAIAFSPDAMNVPMGSDESPTAIAEVKSYGTEKFLATAYMPKDRIEERWQIATAMALLDSIERGHLVLFNPKMKHCKTFVIEFDRLELEHEIEITLSVEEDWKKFVESGPLHKRPPSGAICSSIGKSEIEIMKEIETRQRLNP